MSASPSTSGDTPMCHQKTRFRLKLHLNKANLQRRTYFKPALTVLTVVLCSVSDAWGVGELNSNPTGTLIRLIYRHCCTAQNIVIDEKYIDDENEKSSQLMMF